MLCFICFFFPAILSVCIFEYLSKHNLKLKNIVYRFCVNTVFINLVCLLIKKFILGTIGEPITVSGDMLPAVALNYLIMAIPLSVLFALAQVFLSKNVSFTVKEDEKED